MINRVILSGYLTGAIVQRKRPRLEYWFRLYMRSKAEDTPTNTCYLANICVSNPKALKYFPGSLERGDFVVVEGEAMSRRVDGASNWHTYINAFCVFNMAAYLESSIGDARIRRQEQLAELYNSILCSQSEEEGENGLDVF